MHTLKKWWIDEFFDDCAIILIMYFCNFRVVEIWWMKQCCVSTQPNGKSTNTVLKYSTAFALIWTGKWGFYYLVWYLSVLKFRTGHLNCNQNQRMMFHNQTQPWKNLAFGRLLKKLIFEKFISNLSNVLSKDEHFSRNLILLLHKDLMLED